MVVPIFTFHKEAKYKLNIFYHKGLKEAQRTQS